MGKQSLAQTEIYKDTPVAWPSLFIDFNTFTFSEFTQQAQAAAGELQCRLAFPITTADGSTFIDKNTALEYYEAELQLHQALQGWTNGSIAPLSRTQVSTEERDDNFRVRKLIYSLYFNEYTIPPTTSEIARPPLELLS
jgi:hypothetical protein